jgi:hypothetical protein
MRAAQSRPSGAGPIALRLIARSRGGRGPGMLEALLEGVTDKQLHEFAAASRPAELLARATRIIVQADHILQSAGRGQRAALRGFSEAMLAVAADQTCRLAHLLEQHDRAIQGEERARKGLTRAMLRADALVSQAIWILKKVSIAGEEQARALEAMAKPADEGERALELSKVLLRIIDTAQRLLGEGSTSVQRRAALYGLDASYLEDLKKTSGQLSDLHARVRDQGRTQTTLQVTDRDHANVAFLVQQIIEAFAAARALDPSIPPLSATEPEAARGTTV